MSESDDTTPDEQADLKSLLDAEVKAKDAENAEQNAPPDPLNMETEIPPAKSTVDIPNILPPDLTTSSDTSVFPELPDDEPLGTEVPADQMRPQPQKHVVLPKIRQVPIEEFNRRGPFENATLLRPGDTGTSSRQEGPMPPLPGGGNEGQQSGEMLNALHTMADTLSQLLDCAQSISKSVEAIADDPTSKFS